MTADPGDLIRQAMTVAQTLDRDGKLTVFGWMLTTHPAEFLAAVAHLRAHGDIDLIPVSDQAQ